MPDHDQPSGARGGLLGRAGVSVLDNLVSAATNLLITLTAARTLDADDFGRFGVVYLLATFALGAARAGVGQPALVRQEAALARGAADPYGSALALGTAASAIAVVGALVLGGELFRPLLALALVLPAVVLQDVGRLVGFAAQAPERSLVLDLLWCLAELAALAGLALTGKATIATLILAWGFGGFGGAVWVARSRGWRLPAPSFRWVRDSWHYTSRYLTAFVAGLGLTQVTAALLGVVTGVGAVGAVRAAAVLFGPMNSLAVGAMLVLIPAGVHIPLRDQRTRLVAASAATAALAVALTTVGLLVPDDVGTALLGDSWSAARDLLLPAGLVSGLLGVLTGASIGLRAAQAVRETLRVELWVGGANLLLPVSGALLWGAAGYMWGSVAAYGFGAALWWWTYVRVERHGIVLRPPGDPGIEPMPAV